MTITTRSLILILAGAAACRAPSDPVEGFLAAVADAAEARDADAVAARLAADFRGGDAALSRSAAQAELRRYFFTYESVDLTISEVTREPAEGGTRVSFRVDFSGKPKDVGGLAGLVPSLSAYGFDLLLVEGKGGLQAREAAWRRLDADPPPAN